MRQVHYAETIAKDGRLIAYVKQAMNEIPEVLFAAAGATAATVAAGVVYAFTDKKKFLNPKYKMYPIYMRPDDPRAALVHKP